MAIIGKGVFIPPTSEDNRIFATRSAAEDYLETALAKAGQNVMIYDSSTDKYKKFIIQEGSDGLELAAGGSSAIVDTTLPAVADGDPDMDYYIGTAATGYVHYRLIDGAYIAVGGDTTDLETDVADLKTDNTANKQNISALVSAMSAVEREIGDLDIKTYTATYGSIEIDGEERQNIFSLIEKDAAQNETVVSQFQIQGGGSGGGGSTTMTTITIDRVTTSPVIATKGSNITIAIDFSCVDGSNDPVDCTYNWRVGTSSAFSGALAEGRNTFDLTEYCNVGTQKLTLTVTDIYGNVSIKTWTVQIVDVRLESDFQDTVTYPAGSGISFSYTPYGSVSKVVHFVLDNTELTTATVTESGILQYYSLPAQTHGAHHLEVYATATIGSGASAVDVETNHLHKDIIWYDAITTNPMPAPVIACPYKFAYYGAVSLPQYDTLIIPYTVYSRTTESPTVTLAVDGTAVSTRTLTQPSNSWAFRSADVGTHTLTITCGTTVATIKVTITDLGIEINPVTTNLAFDFNPVGYSNSSENRMWSDSTNSGIALTVSNNFDWNNGGYQTDASGDQYFCVKAGTRAYISYNLFGTNPKTSGAEFKVIFKTTNVKNAAASFLQCLPVVGGSDNSSVGLQMKVHEALLNSSASTLDIPYSEEDVIEFEYNINPINTSNASATALIMSYEDGVGYRPMIYDNTHRLHQNAPSPITIGSDDCDVHIYRMKAYTAALSDNNILANFIADARDADTMISRYQRNQIYDENNALTPDSVAEACPHLRIIKIDAPHFTNDKNNYVKGTSVECIYKGGDAKLDNWKFINGYHTGQGTTSNEYGAAGRNINLLMCMDGTYRNKKIEYDATYITQLTMGDNITRYTDGTGKITWTRNSAPSNMFNIKVNIASSENANNALLAKRYNEYLPYKSPARKRDANVKNTMEFVNCVVFIRESDPDVTTHREFQDTNWHFYAIGNIGDAKISDATRVNDPTDPNEFVVEISDNTLANSTFPSGTGSYPIAANAFVAGNTAYDNLYEHWDDTYEFRYEMDGITKAQQEDNKQVWRDFYTWVVTSSDSDFVSQLGSWVVVDSALYTYLFTERYTMIDNRAKNTFWHWGKVYITTAEAAELGDDASNYIIDNAAAAIHNGYRFEFWGYDYDTALGINNSGELAMTYGKEDTDYQIDGDSSSGYIFNAATSTFWCRIRDLMPTQLAKMYTDLEDSNCWSSTSLINEFDAWQSQFPEELWRLDIERKYYRTYQNGTRRFLEEMMNGRKKYQRRQFERDQSMYFGTKYLLTSIKADQIMFRCKTPNTGVVTPNFDLSITPYSDMYINVKYGNSQSTERVRAKAGIQYTIQCPFPKNMTFTNSTSGVTSQVTLMDDTAILIYGASRIQALNDLSACYIHDNDFSKATKLQTLVIGNSTNNYRNTNLTTLSLNIEENGTGLLETLNIRNCPNLAGSLNLANYGSLTTLYAQGTAITSVTFATNGKIATAYLPSGIKTIIMRNLQYLTTLNATYDYLESLTEENSVVDELAIVNDAKDTLQELHVSGIDWTLTSTALLNELLPQSINANSNFVESSLSGTVHITGQVRTPELANYSAAWGEDLTVTYDPSNLIIQYPVLYKNYDGSLIKEVWVDAGDPAPDIYYESLQDSNYENYISLPERPENAQYYYTFGQYDANDDYIEGSGWDNLPSQILGSNTVVNAQYTATAQQYTVKWYSDIALSNPAPQVLKQETVGYGTAITYDGVRPTKAASGINYYIFSGWSASTGCVDRNLDVYPVWEYAAIPAKPDDVENPQEGDFQLQTATPAQLFALREYIKGLNPRSDKRDGITADDYFANKDYYDLCMGHDYNFSNVTSTTLVDVNTPLKLTGRAADIKVFDGSSADRPAIKLFDANAESFTLAVDFRFTDTTSVSGDENTLISCFAPAYGNNAHRGFRLQMSSHPQILWGNQTTYVGNGKKRDIVVLRHIKGSDTLYVYSSNGNNSGFASSVVATALTRSTEFETDAYLCLGGVSNPVDNGLSNYGTGYIYWAKVWNADLGVDVATEMAAWPREIIRLEYAKVPDSLNLRSRYALAGGSSSRTIASFIANNPLADRTRQMNSSNTNAGGWAETNQMRPFLNGKFYSGLPTIWQSLIAQCSIPSTAGSQSSTITYSDNYVYIPSYQEMVHTTQSAPYGSEGAPVLWFNSDIHRAKFPGMIIPVGHSEFTDAGDPVAAGKTVREGDIWKKNGNGDVYIYALPDTIDNKGLSTTNSVASSGDGTWIVASYWWGRSPNTNTTNYFWFVYTNGACTNNYANYSYAVVPSLSI